MVVMTTVGLLTTVWCVLGFAAPAVATNPRAGQSCRGGSVATATAGNSDKTLTAIAAPGAWSLSKGGGVTVAVIDTGIALAAPRSPWVWWAQSRSFVAGEGLADADGHGTEMADIIHTVAPRARILILKALNNSGGGSDRDVANAIRFAVARGAQIINLSAAGGGANGEVGSAVTYAGLHGVLVVMAAGNDGVDLDKYPSGAANYQRGYVVVVAATDLSGNLIGSSDYGRHTVSLGAPGLDIPTLSVSGMPTQVTGTSPAAALTSGTAALVLARSQGQSVSELRNALLNGSRRKRPLASTTASGGMLDASGAVECASGNH